MQERYKDTSKKHVLVIGAGFAGLVAALELEQRGHDVAVIEASGCVGGRIRTWYPEGEEGGPSGELGAMRIPAQHVAVLSYVRRAGLESSLVPFVSPFATSSGWFARAGASARWPEAEARLFARPKFEARLRRELRADTLRFVHRFEAMLDAVAPRELRQQLDLELTGELLEELDALDLTPYLDHAYPRVDIEAFFAHHPWLSRYFSATTMLFMRDVALETQRELWCIDGGMERLPRALAKLLRRSPRLATPARRIERQEHQVLVHYGAVDGSAEEPRAFDWVVCTIPFSAMCNLELVGFGAEKLRRIAEQRYCSAVKALMHCNQPFWLADGVEEGGGASCLDGLTRQMYYPRHVSAARPGAVLLAAYATGADARALSAMPEESRWKLIRQQAASLHPGFERSGGAVVVRERFIDWDEEPWIRGGCSVPWLDGAEQPRGDEAQARLREQAEASARPEGRVLFAGEHCSTLPAWLEGAALSARAAVAHIMEDS